MLLKKFALPLIVLGLGAGLAWAGPIEDRQKVMKTMGKGMGDMAPMFKGEKAYDANFVKETTDNMLAAFGTVGDKFPPDSGPGGAVETWAKPEIWTDMETFKKSGENAYMKLQALNATTDEAAFKAAFGEVGGTCKTCHDKFRRPKDN